MSTYFGRSTVTRVIGILLFCLSIFFFPKVQAQTQEETDPFGVRRGFNVIEGRIFTPSGQPIGRRIKVTLQSVSVSDGFAFTNDRGEFAFRRLPEGTYRVTVDAGKQYEIHNETVDVIGRIRRRGDQTEAIVSIAIYLKVRATSGNVNEVVNAALASVPKPALDLYEKAGQAVKAGDNQRAIELFEEAIAIYPEFAEAYKELGLIHFSLRNGEKAVEAFKKAVSIAGENFVYRLNLGYALLNVEKFSQARDELVKAVQLNASSTSALLLLARAQFSLRDYDQAEKNMLAVIKMGGPDTPNAYKMLGVLCDEKGDNARTAEYLEKYLSFPSNDKDVAALVRLSRAQIKLRKLDEAEKNLIKAVGIGGKENSTAHRYLGALYIEKKEPNRAISHLEKYLELVPGAKDAERIRQMIDDLRRQSN